MRTTLTLSILALLFTTGCKKKPPEVELVSAPPIIAPIEEPRLPPTPVVEPEPALDLTTIYFDFDRSNIRPDQADELRRNADMLRSRPRLTIRIEGHCDERGTTDYNIALGQRRAAAARAFLVEQGISPERIVVVSYGEERPADPGHDEAAWARNRRDEFMITGGQSPLVSSVEP